MNKTKRKPRSVEAAKLASNRKAFGQAGAMKDRRKEKAKQWARLKERV